MTRIVAIVVLIAALALVNPVAAQSDVTGTVWYHRFKQVANLFNPQGFSAWEQHISSNKIEIVDTIPRERSQQLLRTFTAMQAYTAQMAAVQQFISTLPPTATFTLSSTGPYAWIATEEYRQAIGGLILAGQHRGQTYNLNTFVDSLDDKAKIANLIDYTARRGPNNARINFAHDLPAPFIGYGCKSGWAVVVADALSLQLQYQRALFDKSRAAANPLDCATVYEHLEYTLMNGSTQVGVVSTDTVPPGAIPGPEWFNVRRNPCQGNTLPGALEYITGRSFASSVPGASPSRGLNPVSTYDPALSSGNFYGSRSMFQSRGYCAAEHRLSRRFYLDPAGERGYKDVGDLAVGVGYGFQESQIERLLNFRQPGRRRGRTGPLISSVYAGHPYFQCYSGGVFQNVQTNPSVQTFNSCPPSAQPTTPVIVMGYYNVENATSYWIIRPPFGPTWGIQGTMQLAKNTNQIPGGMGVCGIGAVVGAFLPPNYHDSALPPSTMC